MPDTNLLTYAGGSGNPNDPYQIADTNNLKDMSRTPCDWDKHFILTADLDMSGVAISQIDISTTAVFSGLFDGGGHTIDNLTINLPTTDNVGLFGAVNGIMDRGPINSNLTGGRIVGGLLGSVGSNPPDSTVNNSFWDI